MIDNHFSEAKNKGYSKVRLW